MKTSYNISQKERRNIKMKINPYPHQKKDTVNYSLLLLYKEVLDSKV